MKKFINLILWITAVIVFLMTGCSNSYDMGKKTESSEVKKENFNFTANLDEEPENPYFKVNKVINEIPYTPEDFTGEYVEVEFSYTTHEGLKIKKKEIVGIYDMNQAPSPSRIAYDSEGNSKIGKYCVKEEKLYFLDMKYNNLETRYPIDDSDIPKDVEDCWDSYIISIDDKAILELGSVLLSVDLKNGENNLITKEMLDYKVENNNFYFTTFSFAEYQYYPKNEKILETGNKVIRYLKSDQKKGYQKEYNDDLKEISEEAKKAKHDGSDLYNDILVGDFCAKPGGNVFRGKTFIGNYHVQSLSISEASYYSINNLHCLALESESNISIWSFGSNEGTIKLPNGNWTILKNICDSSLKVNEIRCILLEQDTRQICMLQISTNDISDKLEIKNANLFFIGKDVVDVRVTEFDLLFMTKNLEVYCIQNWNENAEKKLVGKNAIGIKQNYKNSEMVYLVSPEGDEDSVTFNGYYMHRIGTYWKSKKVSP